MKKESVVSRFGEGNLHLATWKRYVMQTS